MKRVKKGSLHVPITMWDTHHTEFVLVIDCDTTGAYVMYYDRYAIFGPSWKSNWAFVQLYHEISDGVD